jgi:hypothetical protein
MHISLMTKVVQWAKINTLLKPGTLLSGANNINAHTCKKVASVYHIILDVGSIKEIKLCESYESKETQERPDHSGRQILGK